MTTIEEMDEFFDFDDAAQAHPPSKDLSYLIAGPCDLDLVFTGQNNVESSFCLEQIAGNLPEEHLSFDLHNSMQDAPLISPNTFTASDFTDFPRWIEGMNVPFQPCNNCKRTRTHCKVLKEGHRKGSCTSCVALAKSCSLTYKIDEPIAESCEGGGQAGRPQVSPLDEVMDFNAEEALVDWNEIINNSSHWKPISTKSTINEQHPDSHSNSTPNLVSLKSSTEYLHSDAAEPGPKVGARFSREALRTLKNWLTTHHRHPYPTDEEKESLKRQTGLNKTQITNWLANARRRGKVRAPRSISPSPHMEQYANGIDIPRRGTPALGEMNPLERWKNSPPEHEPASVTAIAKAVTSSTYSSGRESPYTSYGHTDDGSGRSLCNVSSTSSLGTSHSSGGSFASAFSHKSHGSFGSFGNRGRRRRRKAAPKPVKANTWNFPTVLPRTYQCTFCTETFKTKHDWQRHEKSLHLSLERWICSPDGPTQHYAQYNHMACVYCGLPNAPEDHAEVHNHSSCAERSLEERTFYRKDHLRQHLNLVHDAKFQAWSMDTWKIVTPEIRSRCGFCGIIMDSWSIRVDHLAEHFKGGKSMADWKGDWGFEPQVLDVVENGMPPYLIHDERNTLRPFEASRETGDLHRTLEDMVKIGLVDYINDHVVQGISPTDAGLLEEARKIILKSELNKKIFETDVSWFRDLIMLSGKPSKEAGSTDLQGLPSTGLPELPLEERLALVNSNIPDSAFNLSSIACPKQRAFLEFVHNRQALGLMPTDSELQKQACKILDDIEATSNFQCKGAVSWFKYLIVAEPNWLAEFRRRAGLPRSSEMAIEHIRSTDDTTIDHSILNMARLESELAEYVEAQLAVGVTPSDSDLQSKARMIVYNSDDPWNQTAADDIELLQRFKRAYGLSPRGNDGSVLPQSADDDQMLYATCSSTSSPRALHWDLNDTGISGDLRQRTWQHPTLSGTSKTSPVLDQPLHTLTQNQPSTNTNPTQPLRYFLNDANCYGRLVRELTRFVTSAMSPNNPNQHVPSDAEIQNQARWVIYDDDDPWNQTAADNAEWLIRFKRGVSLAPPESGPSLPVTQPSWHVNNGGTGFSPPYLNPKAPPPPFVEDVNVKMSNKVYKVSAETAGQFLQSMGERWQKPATVFCSRDLETGLGAYVQDEFARGVVPTDQMLQAKAREILGVQDTAADDTLLLEKFKALHGISSNADDLLNMSPSSTDLAPTYTMQEPLDEFDFSEFENVGNVAGFDTDLAPMDLTTDFGAGVPRNSTQFQGQKLRHLDVGMREVTLEDLPVCTGLNVDGGMASRVSVMATNGWGEMQDYAELYRVNAATASPLRRRASERQAAKVGTVRDPTGNLYVD